MPRRLPAFLILGLAVLAVPASAAAAPPIMPLSQVRPGLDCTGRSVVKGTAISEFDVDVIDVVSDGMGTNRILVRVSGPAVDATGIGPGFSGSPVLCRDGAGVQRFAGAISESVGEYGNKTALATPIEEVLGESPDPPARTRSRPALVARARPLAVPLSVSGLGSRLRRLLSAAARRARRPVLAAPAGPLASFPVQDLRPGAAMSASFAAGDISLGAIGTVTYRDGTSIWGFGHPLGGIDDEEGAPLGTRSLFLQDAYVYDVISNPVALDELGATTYKLAAPGHAVGIIRNDALSAVAGAVGTGPRAIRVQASARDLDSGRGSQVTTQVADERDLDLEGALPLVAALATAQVEDEVQRSAPPRSTSSMCLRMHARESTRTLGFCGSFLDGDPIGTLGEAVSTAEAYDFGPLHLTDVTARLRVRRGLHEDFLVRGSMPRRVRAGQLVRVRLVLRRRRDGRERLSFPLRIPRSLGRGSHALRLSGPVSGGGGSDESILRELLVGLEGSDGSGRRAPRSIAALARQIRSLKPVNGLRGTFRSRHRGPVVYRNDSMLLRGRVRIPFRVVR